MPIKINNQVFSKMTQAIQELTIEVNHLEECYKNLLNICSFQFVNLQLRKLCLQEVDIMLCRLNDARVALSGKQHEYRIKFFVDIK